MTGKSAVSGTSLFTLTSSRVSGLTWEVKTTKSGQRKFINVVRAYSIGDTKFDEDHQPIIDAKPR